MGYMSAAAVTRDASLTGNFDKVILSMLKLSKVLLWFTLFWFSMLREGRGGHFITLTAAPGQSASRAPAGKMRTHLGLDSGVRYRARLSPLGDKQLVNPSEGNVRCIFPHRRVSETF